MHHEWVSGLWVTMHPCDEPALCRNPAISWAKCKRAAHAPVYWDCYKNNKGSDNMTQCWENELLVNKGLWRRCWTFVFLVLEDPFPPQR